MNVLVTGAYGRCGIALIDHFHNDVHYDFTYQNRSDRPVDHPYGDAERGVDRGNFERGSAE